MARATMESIRQELAEERAKGEQALAQLREQHADELARCEQQLNLERRDNAKLQATLGIIKAALDQVTS